MSRAQTGTKEAATTIKKDKKSESKNLVIVESPAKAKTIKKFLGKDYKIEASMGHVRDLPKSELGVDVKNEFEPKYITIRGKGELLSKLRKEVKSADKIYLATDPDREGEAISWHLVYALRLDGKDFRRITFNEITKNAVKKSIKEAREIDMNLVDAQQSRRVLDRVVGYGISPLLWKKIKKGLSAGRVQSVALRVICEREEEISSFIPTEYWTIDAEVGVDAKKTITANFYGTKDGKMNISKKEEADKIIASVKRSKLKVTEVKSGTRTRKPMPPFTTSTLQQEASKVLGYATQKTMLIAQQLYEGVDIKGEGTIGLVSYIRTDSVRISDEAYEDSKKYISETFGEQYVSPERPVYKTKSKSQDAHEAIRPTSFSRNPEKIKELVTKEQYKLYNLIWSRCIASQMSPAQYETKSIKLEAGKYQFRTSGSLLKFSGFLEVYSQKDEQYDNEKQIPDIEKEAVLKLKNVSSLQHFTQPPPRYTDASLVKTLEELGVGRPSTYSPTITTIIHRRYVLKENKNFFPTELGEVVNEIMTDYFKDIVSTDFTADLEQQLDKVEDGEKSWREVLKNFYFKFETDLKNAEEQIGEIEIADEVSEVICENCGRNMVIKYGKYGKFLACPSFPECKNAKPLYEDAGVPCPICEAKVIIKKTKKGRRYYGCENNPECEFISWNKPTGGRCPDCGQILVEKGSKNKKIACVNVQCGYVKEYEEKPDN